jgi:protein TonB
LSAGEQGSVQISVQVAPDGRVASCSVTQSSGSAALDDASCRLWSTRARYDPARDSFGRAISDRHSQRIHWRLPFKPEPEPPVE